MENKIELLAPAGNLDSLKAAIHNGANAVYLGLNDFNARGNIENFSINNLKESVDFAHLFNVKIYITLNTLIKDDEFNKVYNLVKYALKVNVDAFIVQDLGLAHFLKQHFPNIELHASTQMGIENLEGALFAKKLGFKRIVLSRETPVSEIRRIKENCAIELEYFIQGALCVSFSGNCYMCSLLANSSGNRGKCKQFCRLPYVLKYENIKKEGYLLSTKDFCMVPILKELVDAGVTSLKIEGRARRPSYVGQAVKSYRKLLDNNYDCDENDIIDLKKAFNRGDYIQGYFSNEKIIYSKAQNHIGIDIGEIIEVNNGKKFNELTLKTNYDLHKEDVLKFFYDDKEIGVITIKDLKKINVNLYKITTTAIIKKYSKVRLIVDSQNEAKILSIKKKIEVQVNLTAIPNQKLLLELNTDSSSIKFKSDFILQQANSMPISYEDCFKQISKMGGNFQLKKLTCDLRNVFIAKSQLNEVRRKSLELLQEQIIKDYEKLHKLKEKNIENHDNLTLFNNIKVNQKKMIIFDKEDDFDKIMGKYDFYIYQPSEFDIEKIKHFYKKYETYNIFLSLPIMANENEINYLKEILKECPQMGVYANNYYALDLVSKDKTIIGSNLNVFNSYSVNYYATIGYKNIVLSIENIDISGIKNSGANLFIMNDFYPEYMYFRHCPIKEHLNGECSKCLFNNRIEYQLNNNKFKLVRRRIITCQFVLKSKQKVIKNSIKNFNIVVEI